MVTHARSGLSITIIDGLEVSMRSSILPESTSGGSCFANQIQ